MAIKITQDESWALAIHDATIQSTQSAMERAIRAKTAFLVLLELKYNAQLNPMTGQLEPKPKETKEKPTEKTAKK